MRGSERTNDVSREWRMSAGILLPAALFLPVLPPDVLPLKACRGLSGSLAGSMRGSTAFPAHGADGIVRERSCSEATLDVGVLREKGLTDGWLREPR